MSMKFTDIDECSLATTPCDQECTNLNGSFQCTCRPGYSLEEDKTTCSSMSSDFLVNVRLGYILFLAMTVHKAGVYFRLPWC